MSARTDVPRAAMDCIDGERRAKRVIRCIEHGMALSPDSLLHELQDVFAADGEYPKATPRVRAFVRVLAKRLEGVR
jgi:hypothetical protein